MTLQIGNRPAIQCDSVDMSGGCVVAYRGKAKRQLVLAYCLIPGERLIWGNGDAYEVA